MNPFPYPEGTKTREDRKAYLETLVSGPYMVRANGMIDCVLDHPIHSPIYGPLPYTACPNDSEEHCNLIHEICETRIAEGAEYTEQPDPEPESEG
ncbi:hypothetical protein [Qingshengfaniella alkalisoli]|uniref:Uncharacterized protein n=1 Tax=Qingshengfaniella alkalisoli TaxID=2599296 RepID=A0A5B8J720_9RHOB|nr:hypothetical protein [Qingshengfaniella alkalisoli]QDY70130.1 hypothetical protein FPZ52_11190 [Qingshengfaniella alkalisoli]